MIQRILLNTGRFTNRVVQLKRQVHKGPEGAPPMRFVSPIEHVAYYTIIAFAILSYPTYVMYNLDNLRPPPENKLSPELQQVLDERAARRKEGKQPILQDWPIIHQKQ